MIRVNDTLSSSSGTLHPQPRLVTETCPIEHPPRARKSYEPAPRISLDVVTLRGLSRTDGAVSLGRQPTSLRPVCCGPVPPAAGRLVVRHTFTNRDILIRQIPSNSSGRIKEESHIMTSIDMPANSKPNP